MNDQIVATARLVRPAYRPVARAPIRSEADILSEDLGVALDEVDRLKEHLKKSQAALGSATAQLKRQNEIIEQLRAASDGSAAATIAQLRKTIALLRETIAALHKTLASSPQPVDAKPVQSFTVGSLTLDLTVSRLVFGDYETPLSPGEVQILICLFERPGTVIPTADLIARMHGQFTVGAIRSYVFRVRKRLEKFGAQNYLQSRRIRGWGGYWVAEPRRRPE